MICATFNSHRCEAGYYEGLAQLPLPWHGVAYAEDISCEAGSQALRQMQQQAEPPDAVLAVSDVLAVGVVHAAREAGLRVPEDLAVVGFDDIPFTSSQNPPLTTAEQPMYQLGARSVQLLLQCIRRPDSAVVREVLE